MFFDYLKSLTGRETSSRKGHARDGGSAPSFRLETLEDRRLLAGAGLAGAYFARTNLTLAKYSQADAAIDFVWPSGTPHAALGTDGFSVRWSGQVLGKFSETYTFTTVSSGGVRLWVNNFLIIDAWSDHERREDSGSLRLTAGKLFDIRLEYWSDGSDPEVELDWASPRTARQVVPGNRLYAANLDTVAPTMPGRLRASSATGTSASLIWDASSDPSGVVSYDIYIGSTKYWSNLPGQTTYTRTNLAPNTGYVFSVQAVDAAGNSSPLATTAVTTAAPSNPAPTAPGNLQVTSATLNSVSLNWTASTDNSAVTGYRIYRNGVKLNVAPTGTSFTDTTVSAGTLYSYTVRAADDAGAFSPYSNTASVTTPVAGTHNPYTGIDAVDYDQQNGVSTSGSTITGADNNDWVRYTNVQFGSGTGANSVLLDLGLSPSSRGGSIELRLDGVGGTLIARHLVQPTGGSGTFFSQRLNVSNVTGTHDLYVVFKDRSDVARLRSIRFSTTHLTRIMPLGDSITESPQSPLSSSYRYYLYKKLLNAGKNFDFVGSRTQAQNDVNPPVWDFDQNHESHSGWTADEIAAQAAGWAAQFQPEIVLLHIGTNDLNRGQSVSSTISDIEDIIDNLRSSVPNVKIFLAQIIPLVGHESTVDELNEEIALLAGQKSTGQSPIAVVDQNSGFSLADTEDGIHPSEAMESAMADRWYAQISSLLQ